MSERMWCKKDEDHEKIYSDHGCKACWHCSKCSATGCDTNLGMDILESYFKKNKEDRMSKGSGKTGTLTAPPTVVYGAGESVTTLYGIGEQWPPADAPTNPYIPPSPYIPVVPPRYPPITTVSITPPLLGRLGRTAKVRVRGYKKEDVYKNINNHTINSETGALILWRDLVEVAIYPKGEWLRLRWEQGDE